MFASRSPHRPCPLGLTLARLERVEGNTLHLTGIDLIDGTPILDVKPYVPNYDTPVEALRSIPMATTQPEETKVTRQDLRPAPEPLVGTAEDSHGGVCSEEGEVRTAGWPPVTSHGSVCSEEGEVRTAGWPPVTSHGSVCSEEGEVRTAGWLRRPPVTRLNVQFLPKAEEQLRKFKPVSSASTHSIPPPCTEDPDSNASANNNPYFLEAFSSPAEARRAIIEILQEDPRSVYRRKRCKRQSYRVSIDNLNLSCQFEGNTAIVEDILPKYSGKDMIQTQ